MQIKTIKSLLQHFDQVLQLPGSKSITNRALILASLCQTKAPLSSLLISDDTNACQQALKAAKTSRNIYCQDAGTVARFMLPLCASLRGEYIFDGSARLRERPLAPLFNILIQQGVRFEWLNKTYQLPCKMISHGLKGGRIIVDVTDSSQFLSGLLMVAPRSGMEIIATKELVQLPYVQMTLHLMQHFGININLIDASCVFVAKQSYIAKQLTIEPDASTASYFFAAAALTNSTIRIPGLGLASIQGDLKFLEPLRLIGCDVIVKNNIIILHGPKTFNPIGSIDMQGFSDTFMTLAILAPFLPTPTTLYGLKHTKLQESDRIQAMANGLQRLGIHTTITDDSLTVFPGVPKGCEIHSYNDHRIAMSFATLGLRVPEIKILSPGCVTKTCPDFFKLIENLGSHGS